MIKNQYAISLAKNAPKKHIIGDRTGRQVLSLIDNPAITSIASEYDLDIETFYECLAHACRKLYGVLEIDRFEDDKIMAFSVGHNGFLIEKTINITKSGMQRIIRETILLIESIKNEKKKNLEMFSYKSVLSLLETDLFTISKSKVSFKIISQRSLNEKEKKSNPGVDLFIVVRANRYLNAPEKRYFQEKSSSLKKGVKFVLD